MARQKRENDRCSKSIGAPETASFEIHCGNVACMRNCGDSIIAIGEMSLENKNNTLSEQQPLPRRPHDPNVIRFFLQAFLQYRGYCQKKYRHVREDMWSEIISANGEMMCLTVFGNCIQLIEIPFWLFKHYLHRSLHFALFMNGNA